MYQLNARLTCCAALIEGIANKHYCLRRINKLPDAVTRNDKKFVPFFKNRVMRYHRVGNYTTNCTVAFLQQNVNET
jgi:hypothetical protein